jgi:hypothetical protein
MGEDSGQVTPPFGEAVRRLRAFFASQSLSTEFRWVFRKDVICHKQNLLIKEPIPEGNERLAQALYEHGRRRGLGLRIETLCLLNSHPCCYIWLPKTEEDAQYALHLFSRFLISAPIDLCHARSVVNPIKWLVHGMSHDGENREFNKLPHTNF